MSNQPTEQKEAFKVIYKEQSNAIFRFCLSRVTDRDQALDLTQETFTRLWKSLQDERDMPNPRAFLFTIARNLIIDWYRKKKSVSLETILSDGEDEHMMVDDKAYERLGLQAEGRFLIEKISKLSVSHQEIVYLRFLEGLSPSEIGSILGLSPNAVSIRIMRGLEELKKITGYDIEEDIEEK